LTWAAIPPDTKYTSRYTSPAIWPYVLSATFSGSPYTHCDRGASFAADDNAASAADFRIHFTSNQSNLVAHWHSARWA